MRNLQKDIYYIYMSGERTDTTASDILARSFMGGGGGGGGARTLEENGKECQAEGEAKVVE